MAIHKSAALLLFLLTTTSLARELPTSPSPNGIAFPDGYSQWQVIATSQRTDNNTQRYILGNPIAVEAAKSNQTNPWPDGSILAKVVWKSVKADHWPAALVPESFVHSEFMLKDTSRWPETGGWGYARWVGKNLQPYGENANFDRECMNCHQPVANQDYVFTRPALPPDPQD